MHHPTDRITHTPAFVTPVVEHWLEREIAQWVHSMMDRSDDPSHNERTLLPRSYSSLQFYNKVIDSASHVLPSSLITVGITSYLEGTRCSYVVKTSARGAIGRRIDHSW